MIPWLDADTPFPEVATALREPNGLLCAGADLSPARLLPAYQRGIFPWFSPGEPILWWSPDPRMVLMPQDLILRRSLHKVLRNHSYEVRLDSDFVAVMAACAAPRAASQGSWITAAMQDAYTRLHQLGYAHSVEVWQQDQLVGGLYGVALGGVFFGESMFTRVSNASKIALAHLCRFLDQRGFVMIDCQMYTDHLASLGARPLARHEFMQRLQQHHTAAHVHQQPGRWASQAAAELFRTPAAEGKA